MHLLPATLVPTLRAAIEAPPPDERFSGKNTNFHHLFGAVVDTLGWGAVGMLVPVRLVRDRSQVALL